MKAVSGVLCREYHKDAARPHVAPDSGQSEKVFAREYSRP